MHERLDQLAAEPRHVVVIGGGAVSGSEAAAYCAERGVVAIVLEQNTRPYGKIEDGLPRWHDKLRQKEYERIDENLSRPGVYFVPRTKLAIDIPLEAVRREWGASAVLLASGAWRDRPLPVAGADAFVDKGLVYQNAFVYWFNHYEEPEYRGPRFTITDDAIVVGGGLASVDVVKIINLELYRTALRARGIAVSVVELEHKGIPATLAEHRIDRSELGLQGCTLYYRRRVRDMPLAFAKEGATPEQLLKTEGIREKMVNILRDKFFIRVRDGMAPVGLVRDGDRLAGLTFRRTEVRDGVSAEVEGSEQDVRSALIVSSIGSVPEALAGIPTRGELYHYASWDTGALQGLPGVFGLGNVLTGKGNIRESRDNAAEISNQVVRDYIGVDGEEGRGERTGEFLHGAHHAARMAAKPALDSAIRRAKTSTDKLRVLASAIDQRWQSVGYDGEYRRWIAQHKPYS